jgi:hypothetical protein
MNGSRFSLWHINHRAFKVFNQETKQNRYTSKKLLDKYKDINKQQTVNIDNLGAAAVAAKLTGGYRSYCLRPSGILNPGLLAPTASQIRAPHGLLFI